MKILTPQALSAEAFQEFGDVIEATERAKHFEINDGNTIRYHDLMKIEIGGEGYPIVNIFRAQPRTLPFVIKMMERHPLGSQAFIPQSDRNYLVAVAKASTTVSLDDIKVFNCLGTQGVNYAKGVWHHPLLALGSVSDFLVIDRGGAGENCDEQLLTESGQIVLDKQHT